MNENIIVKDQIDDIVRKNTSKFDWNSFKERAKVIASVLSIPLTIYLCIVGGAQFEAIKQLHLAEQYKNNPEMQEKYHEHMQKAIKNIEFAKKYHFMSYLSK